MTNWVKKTIKIIRMKDLEVGTEIIGEMTGFKDREITDRETGEPKTITDLILNVEGDKKAIPLDSGLSVAIKSSEANEGDLIKIVKKEQTTNQKGQPLNQYDLYIAEK